MKAVHAYAFVLALYPTSRGFGYVLFEGPESPYDWGVKLFSGRMKNEKCLEAIRFLIDRHQPFAIAIEDVSEGGVRRSPRIRRLYLKIANLAENEHIEVNRYTKRMIQTAFRSTGAKTKHEIAEAIGAHIPAFKHRLPPERKPWMSEDSRMSLFDAAALGLTYYSDGPARGEVPRS